MNRILEVLVDSASWAPNPVPVELSALVGTRSVNVLTALIFTALWTRPPTNFGFHLSDLWAWHRYLPALATTSELRLREEWTTVDPHQKTILSDELGVGFTTLLIQEAFQCGEFVDTGYVIKVIDPARFYLYGGAGAGAKKSPDYMALLNNSEYLVLECKGTQSSRAALKSAITRGRSQKKNLNAVGSQCITHSLVAGLFLPQWLNLEGPCISVSDPPWEEFERFLSGQPKAVVGGAITQVALAKFFALSGASALSEYLISGPVWELREPSSEVRREIEGLLESTSRVVFDSADVHSRESSSPTSRLIFFVIPPKGILDRLSGSASVQEVISGLSKQDHSGWRMMSGEYFSEVMTPLGFSFRLEVESQSESVLPDSVSSRRLSS